MAHMVFKKPLQNQAIRENYIKQRQELRYAKEMGFIDIQAYKDAKKILLPDTTSFDGMPVSPSVVSLADSGSKISDGDFSSLIPKHSPPSEIRKGSILDRNNIARLVYKPDAQGEEDRGEQKELRKTHKSQMQAEKSSKSKSYHDSALDLSPSGQLAPGPYSMHLPIRTTTSDSSRSLKSSKNFNIFRKLSASASRNPPPMPMLDNPSTMPLTNERDQTRPKRHSGFSDTSSRISGSSVVRRNTESHGGNAVSSVTFADKFLFGSSPRIGSEESSRRHSFSSLNARPSFTSSRDGPEADGGVNDGFIFESRPSSSEVGQHFPHGPQEPISPRSSQPQQPLLSTTTTQEVFLSLLNEFANTSILFSYPKYGRNKHDSLSGSFCSVSCSTLNLHEEEIGKAIGGEDSFLIDEGAITLESILEKRAWFLMAMKWLSFGRVLFSPGHHIIGLSGDVGVGVRGPGACVLDLDGTATGECSNIYHPFVFALNQGC